MKKATAKPTRKRDPHNNCSAQQAAYDAAAERLVTATSALSDAQTEYNSALTDAQLKSMALVQCQNG